MQLSRNTSTSRQSRVLGLLVKAAILLLIIFGLAILLSKIDFPVPKSDIEKTIPNEKLKIVK
jgi:hypothetical protein|tara:strand:- start:1945 stop:2130 length:186 start_codon:yes stop_codon:yes gene_type:complete